MLSLQTLSKIKAVLTSDRVRVGGHELMDVAQVVQEVHMEEQRLLNA